MQTIRIGSYGRRERDDHVVEYNEVTTRISSGSSTTRPQFCLELVGAKYSITIYAASEQAFKRLASIVNVNNPNRRITPGPDVLGIHMQNPPRGWPCEAIGLVSERRAPESIIASASAGMPSRPPSKYLFRTAVGVEVISLSPHELNRFAHYHPDDAIRIQNRNVTVTFGKQNSDIFSLDVMTSHVRNAISLATSFARKSPRRLMINHTVTSINLVLANGTETSLVNPPSNACNV